MYATNSFLGNNPFLFVKSINCRHTFTPTSENIRISISGTSRFALTNLSLDHDNVDTLISRYEISRGCRYGFQNQEKDDEIKGKGNSVNYTYRMHDPRIGRFFTTDPLTAKYPNYTPYSFSGNKVIHAVELEGLEEYIINVTFTEISKQYFDPVLQKSTNVTGVKIYVKLLYVKSENRTKLNDVNGNPIEGSENREVDIIVNGVMLDMHNIPSGTVYEELRDEKFTTTDDRGGNKQERTVKEAVESGINYTALGLAGGVNEKLVGNKRDRDVYQVNIFYGSNKDVNMGDLESTELKILADLMVKFPMIHLDIESMTDRVGSDSENLKLSKQRATNTSNGILQEGGGKIDKSRIKANGTGEKNATDRKQTDNTPNQAYRRTTIKPRL